MKELQKLPRRDGRHPIAVVADRTGLSQDVLRVWERRYAAVTPERGPGGQRVYTDADIERLGLLAAATRGGRSISQVARLTTDEVAALVGEDLAARERLAPPPFRVPDAGDVVDAALAFVRSLDATQLDQALRRTAARVGATVFLESVAAPLLRRVGDEWHAGRLTPAQEHLASGVLQGIVAETMRAFAEQPGAPAVLVTTPSGDRHAIGAALVGAAAAVEGWNVVYLGADLPAADIAVAADSSGVRVVAVSIVYVEDRGRVLREMRALKERLPEGVVLLAGGAGARVLAAELEALGVRVETSIPGLVAELRRAGHARQSS